MSRIGKQLIIIPEKVEVSFNEGLFKVKGPLGELSREFKGKITIIIEGNEIKLTPAGKNARENSTLNPLWGTYAAHIRNMIIGVTTGFTKELIIEGIGFKAAIQGENLVLELGFSHSIKLPIPTGLKVVVEKGNVTIKGNEVESLGQFAASIRAFKPTEPYKGKGIRYVGEHVLRKQGKRTAA